ncbi:hypothetical protein GCM10027413_11460 [Conyzicola nivalis]|uniref:Uncharacterized protein n=1 Tax=Conyzicola nivalis TaxID=1477021 RepID=A0A916SI98_9MICO|nr:hypothetical protein GCM10010979_15170 [Conyzicola nivalis]
MRAPVGEHEVGDNDRDEYRVRGDLEGERQFDVHAGVRFKKECGQGETRKSLPQYRQNDSATETGAAAVGLVLTISAKWDTPLRRCLRYRTLGDAPIQSTGAALDAEAAEGLACEKWIPTLREP